MGFRMFIPRGSSSRIVEAVRRGVSRRPWAKARTVMDWASQKKETWFGLEGFFYFFRTCWRVLVTIHTCSYWAKIQQLEAYTIPKTPTMLCVAQDDSQCWTAESGVMLCHSLESRYSRQYLVQQESGKEGDIPKSSTPWCLTIPQGMCAQKSWGLKRWELFTFMGTVVASRPLFVCTRLMDNAWKETPWNHDMPPPKPSVAI